MLHTLNTVRKFIFLCTFEEWILNMLEKINRLNQIFRIKHPALFAVVHSYKIILQLLFKQIKIPNENLKNV
jgi:hypothetical protein